MPDSAASALSGRARRLRTSGLVRASAVSADERSRWFPAAGYAGDAETVWLKEKDDIIELRRRISTASSAISIGLSAMGSVISSHYSMEIAS